MRTHVFGLVLAALMTRAAPAQPTRTLSKPAAEAAEPFTTIAAVRELSDGRVVVVDPRDRVVQLLTKDLSSAQQVGRMGQGPGEYTMPMQLFAGGADTTLLYDLMGVRLLVIDPAGKPVNTISLAALSGGLPSGPAGVKGFDRHGRLFAQTMGFTAGPQGAQFADTAPVVRLDLKTKTIDTLTFVRAIAPRMQVSGNAQAGAAIKMSMAAYPLVDEWVVMPDGGVAVVRVSDYHVDWIAPSKTKRAAPPIAYERVRVVEADKVKARADRMKAQDAARRTLSSMKAPAGPDGKAVKMPSMTMAEPDEWPAYKPPFSASSVHLAPNGQLWVARLRPAGNDAPLYDVIDANGRVVSRVVLPKKSRVIGFGKGAVYVVRTDEDDLQYLQRFTY
jgi:hypothetical protein